jgi:hypothetical protein
MEELIEQKHFVKRTRLRQMKDGSLTENNPISNASSAFFICVHPVHLRLIASS